MVIRERAEFDHGTTLPQAASRFHASEADCTPAQIMRRIAPTFSAWLAAFSSPLRGECRVLTSGAAALGSGMVLEGKFITYMRLVFHMTQPPTPEERALSEVLLERVLPVQTWYHGGPPDLPIGGALVPLAQQPTKHKGTPREANRWVYFSQEQFVASAHARGAVYEVAPVGHIEVDLECLRVATLLWTDPELATKQGLVLREILRRTRQFRASSARILARVRR